MIKIFDSSELVCALVVAFLWLFDLAWDFIFGSEEEILGSAFGLGSGPRSGVLLA